MFESTMNSMKKYVHLNGTNKQRYYNYNICIIFNAQDLLAPKCIITYEKSNMIHEYLKVMLYSMTSIFRNIDLCKLYI